MAEEERMILPWCRYVGIYNRYMCGVCTVRHGKQMVLAEREDAINANNQPHVRQANLHVYRTLDRLREPHCDLGNRALTHSRKAAWAASAGE